MSLSIRWYWIVQVVWIYCIFQGKSIRESLSFFKQICDNFQAFRDKKLLRRKLFLDQANQRKNCLNNVNWIKNLVRKRKQKGWKLFYFDHGIKIDGQSTVFLLLLLFFWLPKKILTNLWRQFWSCDQKRWAKKTSTSNFKTSRLPDQVLYSIDI